MRQDGSTCRPGFTLIELMVVASVIGVLTGLLLAGLAGSHSAGRSIVCASQLRQQSLAASSYADDHDGRYPIAYMYEHRLSDRSSVLWGWDFTTKLSALGEVTVEPGLLWQHAGAGGDVTRVQQCPSFDGGHNWIADPHTGYNYNTSYIGRGSGESITTPAQIADVRSPSTTAIFGDGGYASGANKFMRSPWASPFDVGFSGRSAGTQAFRHRGATNTAWCDGSVRSLRQAYTSSYAHEAANVAPGTGFLSETNELYDLE